MKEKRMKGSREEKETAVTFLDELLAEGLKRNAADIHIEPQKDQSVIRMRIDGMLTEYTHIERELHPLLVSRAKVLAGMDIAEKRLPQDGHIKMEQGKGGLDVRVSVIPTIYGERAVLRLLNTREAVESRETFGMSKEAYQKTLEILKHTGGLFYITGPTGSGKTTTLYMILERLAERPVNIMTIEDPVERYIDGVNQIQVNNQAGLTFERGLRAILRQAPDIIMVGETRDEQTARTSVRAAVTGHFVLSTLHTRDALGTVARMLDMGVEPYLLADSLCGMLAQRLVRKICPNCAEERAVTGEEARILGPGIERIRTGSGCEACNHTGYLGRIAVHEVVLVDQEMRDRIAAGGSKGELYAYVQKTQKIRTLKESVRELVCGGVTDVEEFLRLTYGE